MKLKFAAGAAAILSMAQPQIAFAQAAKTQCIKEADLSDAIVYAMPSLFAAFRTKCIATLPKDGFTRVKGDAFASSFTTLQDQTWPGAQRVLLVFASAGSGKSGTNDQMVTLMKSLPGEAVRPFIDAIIEQKIAEEIQVSRCADIERGVSLLAPLPPQNIGGLLSFIMQFANTKEPEICPKDRK